MDSEATMLNNALAAIRQQFGDQLRGPMRRTQAEMRRAVQTALGADELAADRLVKKLAETGRLVYVGGADDDRDTAGATGPVISMPGVTNATGTGVGQGVYPAAAGLNVAALGGVQNSQGGPTGPVGAVGPGVDAAAMRGPAQGATPVAGAGTARRGDEDSEGATMGTLGDTNVEGDDSNVNALGVETGRVAEGEGYWQIG